MNTYYNKKILLLQTIAIILVVLGHVGDPFPLFSSWFPYYSFHMPLFIFISGYLFKNDDVTRIKKYIIKKLRKSIIPFYGWLIIYGIISSLLLVSEVVTYGEIFAIKNLIISPWTYGCTYSFTAAWWFIPTLFLVEVVWISSRFLIDKISKGGEILLESISFLIGFLLGSFAIEYARLNNGMYGSLNQFEMCIIKVFFLLPFFHLGYLFKTKIDNKLDGLAMRHLLPCIILVQASLLFLCKNNAAFNVAHLEFPNNALIIYLVSINGIIFWKKISDYLSNGVDIASPILNIGKNTRQILLHHQFLIFLLQILISYLFNAKFVDKVQLKNVCWYTATIYSKSFNIIYVIIGIAGSLFISKYFNYLNFNLYNYISRLYNIVKLRRGINE